MRVYLIRHDGSKLNPNSSANTLGAYFSCSGRKPTWHVVGWHARWELPTPALECWPRELKLNPKVFFRILKGLLNNLCKQKQENHYRSNGSVALYECLQKSLHKYLRHSTGGCFPPAHAFGSTAFGSHPFHLFLDCLESVW